MSVEYCLVRATPRVFEQLQRQPDILQDLMDEFHTASSEDNQSKGYVDSRNTIKGSQVTMLPLIRILYVDEFTTSLLVNFMDENSPFFIALAGWGKSHLLDGVSYGYGDISYYPPDDAKQ